MGTIILKIFNMRIVALLLFVSMAYAYPRPQQDQRPAGAAPAPSYGKQPDGYFQYVNVPGHKEYEFGWNRGHPNHYISRYEQSKDHRFRTRVRWGDAHDGYGEHYWEYNHGPSEYKAAPAHVSHYSASGQIESVEPAPPAYQN